MILIGTDVYKHGIVVGGPSHKVDDLTLPSYGVDGCGITIRGKWLQLAEYITVPALSNISIKSLETVHIPSNCAAFIKIKSTYGRAGFLMFDAPIDPGYSGTVTLRMFNSSTESQKVWTRGGIAMIVVYQLNGHVDSYNGRHK